MAAVAPGARMQGPHARNDVATVPGRPAPVGAPPQNTPPHSVGSSTASPSSSGPTSPQIMHSTVALPTRVAHDPQQRPVQIGRPKPAGFVPAALRPTERPRPTPKLDVKGQQRGHRASQSRSGPPTPPQSLHGSTDSLANAAASSRTSSTSPPNNSSSGDAALAKTTSNNSASRPASIDTTSTTIRSLPSRAASTLSSPTASLSSLSLTGMASAASMAPHPTKAHWKPDAMAATCDAAACPAVFSTFTRRHHCRRCGGVFCHRHASRQVLLDTDARMVATPALSTTDSVSVPGTPFTGASTTTAASSSTSTVGSSTPVGWNGNDGATTPEVASGAAGEDGLLMRADVGLWRACDSCHAEWTNWTEGLREAAESAKSSNGGLGSFLQMPVGLGVPGAERKSSIVGSIAGSVPRDWSWSTF